MTTEQILHLAKIKAQHLLPNCQIRLTAEPNSLWLYNFAGIHYIGSDRKEPAPLPFQGKEVYTMSDKNGNPLADLQLLYRG